MSGSSVAHQHLTFEVFGKVQKVFFRKYTATKAQELQLLGFVSNTKSNTVVGEAIGPQEAIEKFKHWLRNEGSPMSKITDAKFEVKPAASHSYTNFDVKR